MESELSVAQEEKSLSELLKVDIKHEYLPSPVDLKIEPVAAEKVDLGSKKI